MSYNLTEKELWDIINGLGWWFWGSVAALGGANFVGILRLAPAETMLGRVIRVLALIGFLLLGLSCFNTGFGPIALPFILLAFCGMTWQLRQRCIAEGKIKITPMPGASVGLRVMAALVEHPKEKEERTT